MYHVHVQSMKVGRRLHARSMLRWHAVFWRHAQTVALATTLSEMKLAIASVCHELMHAYFIFVLPSHWSSLSAVSVHFLRFSCFSDITPPLSARNPWKL